MEHVRRLGGREKTINFKKDFYLIVDKYRLIANASGYNGEQDFKRR
jgi:hypothetical protein